MMVLLGGKEREEADFQRIFSDSGWALTRIVPTQSAMFIIEGEPALRLRLCLQAGAGGVQRSPPPSSDAARANRGQAEQRRIPAIDSPIALMTH